MKPREYRRQCRESRRDSRGREFDHSHHRCRHHHYYFHVLPLLLLPLSAALLLHASPVQSTAISPEESVENGVNSAASHGVYTSVNPAASLHSSRRLVVDALLPAGLRSALDTPCATVCCSSAAQPAEGEAVMKNEWLSTAMPHGARVQIRSPTWGTWWGPDSNGSWSGFILAGNKTRPPASYFFRVERAPGLAPNQVSNKSYASAPGDSLRGVRPRRPPQAPWSTTYGVMDTTPSHADPATIFSIEPRGTFRVAFPNLRLVTLSGEFVRAGPPQAPWSTTYGVMDTTPSRSDPATIFSIEPRGTGTFRVAFRSAADGMVISNEGNALYRWTSVASSWEEFEVREVTVVPAIRGVNLGSWLVIENWMVPGWYPNPKPWKDGTAFRLQPLKLTTWVTATDGGGSLITSTEASRTNTYNNFRALLNDDGTVRGQSNFTFVFNPTSSYSLALILAPNGKYLLPSSSGLLIAALNPELLPSASRWESAAVFKVELTNQVNGEWQYAKSLGGPQAAAAPMSSFRSAYLSESDFQTMAANNINTVRIPVGYWIMESPSISSSEFPFPSGALASLDWAFRMANKYKIRVWFSPHAVFGTNSGFLGGRSGLCEFSVRNNTLRTLDMIEFLVKRYAVDPAFLGLGLMNEPLAPWNYGLMSGISIDLLSWYYKSAYDIVRKYSPCAYIAIEGRVGSSIWEVHWLLYGTWHTNIVLEQHMYNVFYGWEGLTPQQEVEETLRGRLEEIKGLQSWGMPVLVGEWCLSMRNLLRRLKILVGEWCLSMRNPDPSVTAQFGLNQLKAFSTAKAGWFFWSYKHNISAIETLSFLAACPFALLPLLPLLLSTFPSLLASSFHSSSSPSSPSPVQVTLSSVFVSSSYHSSQTSLLLPHHSPLPSFPTPFPPPLSSPTPIPPPT
ncbi:unnamed protein product [Closterium sp. Naga37s-1]|nr:unnamed protein product [Closterium sp. Naga37s-1]